MSSAVIEIRDLWFAYNGLPVLEDTHLTISQGDFLAVIGPNGGGKTTLLKLMLGLLKPDRGTVRVFGQTPRDAFRRLGYLPQHAEINQGFPITVVDVVLMGLIRQGRGWPRYSAADRKAARRALERMEMWEYRNRRMGELSGGQRQRVLVARTLVSEPELLLLDEPMAGVDTEGQTDFYDLLGELNRTVTIVMVSHDLMVLSRHVQSVACVNRQVYFHDAPEITDEMFKMAFHCNVELVAHGLPHRVLGTHTED